MGFFGISGRCLAETVESWQKKCDELIGAFSKQVSDYCAQAQAKAQTLKPGDAETKLSQIQTNIDKEKSKVDSYQPAVNKLEAIATQIDKTINDLSGAND